MPGQTLWSRDQGTSQPGDIPAGRYEFRFTMSPGQADAILMLCWQQQVFMKVYEVPGTGQRFAPVSAWRDTDNPAGTNDLVILADVEGFWPQLIGAALIALGLLAAGAWLLREIRGVASSPAGSLLVGGFGLLLIVAIGVFVFAMVKTKGGIVTKYLPATG